MQVRSCKCISLDLKRAQSNFWRFFVWCAVTSLKRVKIQRRLLMGDLKRAGSLKQSVDIF